jgi:hypothetical protein
MKEQSHKEEMAAAIRGDFQRLRERGVASELAPRASTESETGSASDGPPARSFEASASVAEPSPGDPPLPTPDTAPPDDEPAAPPAAEREPDEGSESSAGWLGRLLGRS